MTAEPTPQVTKLLSPKPIGEVRYCPPTVVTVDASRQAALGHGVVRLRFDFELVNRQRRARFVAAFLRVRFDDQSIFADEMWTELAQDGHTTSISMLYPGGLGWLIGDPARNDRIADRCVVYALVQVPLRIRELRGAMRVDTTVTVPAPAAQRRVHASSDLPGLFTLSLPGEWSSTYADVTDPHPAEVTPQHLPRPAVRLCVAADVERFSRFSLPEAGRAQRRFIDAMAAARANAYLDETGVALQESGDGQFAVLPPGLDESTVLPQFVDGLRVALRETNADLNEHARLRLRVALHRGHMLPAANGWVGNATIAVHRLLDSEVLRRTLADTPGADFALIVSDLLYRDTIRHRFGTLDPDQFMEVDAAVPAKRFAERAWVHVPR